MTQENQPDKASIDAAEKTLAELANEGHTEPLRRLLVRRLHPMMRNALMTNVIGAFSPQELVEFVQTINENLPEDRRADLIRLISAGRQASPEGGNKAAISEQIQEENLRGEDRETGHTVVVYFTDKAYGVVKELMDRSRTANSLSTVLTQALAFEKWYRDAVAAHNRVYVDRGWGKFHEVKRP